MLLTKTKARLRCGSIWTKQMGGKLFQGIQALGQCGLCWLAVFHTACWWPLQSGPPEYWPLELGWAMWSHENGQILFWKYGCKQRRSWSEGLRFKTWCQQGLFTEESPFISTFLLEICVYKINPCVRSIVWLHNCFTCERWNMSSINKSSTRMVPTFFKVSLQLPLPLLCLNPTSQIRTLDICLDVSVCALPSTLIHLSIGLRWPVFRYGYNSQLKQHCSNIKYNLQCGAAIR